MTHTIADSLVLARRNLKRIPRQPDLLLAYTVQPVMFVLLFVYVFGGAIQTPGFDYVDFLMPGIIVQSIAFGGFVTALGLTEDVHKGLIDRFRSLPMSRAAVLAGRTTSDILLNLLSLVVLLTVGFIVGFNFVNATAGEIALGILLLLLMGYAFSWVFALIGLLSATPETANSYGFMLIFPLTFASSVFVPAESMPDGLKQFAEANPFTTWADAVRSLWIDTPAGSDVWIGVPVVHRAAGDLRAAGRPPLPDGHGAVGRLAHSSGALFASSQRSPSSRSRRGCSFRPRPRRRRRPRPRPPSSPVRWAAWRACAPRAMTARAAACPRARRTGSCSATASSRSRRPSAARCPPRPRPRRTTSSCSAAS